MSKINIYDFNKLSYSSVPPLEDFSGAEQIIKDYIESANGKYYILLCNENKYYTLFSVGKATSDDVTKEVLSVIKELGPVKDILKNEITGVIECWIEYNGEVAMFVLFDYTRGVIEV